MTNICISKLTIICSYNGLLPGQHQAIILPNAGILLNGLVVTNFSESEMYVFLFKKIHLKCRLRNGGHFVLASMCLVALIGHITHDHLEFILVKPLKHRNLCPSVNLFSNQIGSLSFPLIFQIFGSNVHNNIA